MSLKYWYPQEKITVDIGHLYKSTRSGKALCGKLLGVGHRGPWLRGRKICEKCKAQRAKIKTHVSLDWSQISPQSEDFMALTPEQKMTVLAARYNEQRTSQ